MKKRAVIAIGGHSLISDSNNHSIEEQSKETRKTMALIADLIEEDYEIVITHGNGPQVGFSLLKSNLCEEELFKMTLDVCVSETQGSMGYMLQCALDNELKRRDIDKLVATIVTQTVIDRGDPAFGKPSKPIGPVYSREYAMKKKKEEGWDIVGNEREGWRRVVPSPRPVKIIEVPAIKNLLKSKIVVIAAGGGGIPVYRDNNGELIGIAAVVDKDYASALMAEQLKVDLLIITTDVSSVYLHYNRDNQTALKKLTLKDAKRYISEGHFGEGSMLPKITAATEFLEKGGKEVIITDNTHLLEAVKGKAGTLIIR